MSISIRVANKVHAVFSSTEQYVDSVCRFQEPNTLHHIATYKRDDDDFRFLTLEVVDSGDSQDLFRFWQKSIKLHRQLRYAGRSWVISCAESIRRDLFSGSHFSVPLRLSVG